MVSDAEEIEEGVVMNKIKKSEPIDPNTVIVIILIILLILYLRSVGF